jgi:glycine/D-amino acid oxidase-like deaminating enzyme
MERYDVAIVGARVAGSTLAALLGRLGVCVLLLDQVTFPSDTLSTHLLRRQLRCLGGGRCVAGHPGDRRGADGSSGTGCRAATSACESVGWRARRPFCLRRIRLDAVLFENAARTAGVVALEERMRLSSRGR